MKYSIQRAIGTGLLCSLVFLAVPPYDVPWQVFAFGLPVSFCVGFVIEWLLSNH